MALWLVGLLPALFVFERMGISDSLGSALALAALDFAWSPRLRVRDAMLAGLCLPFWVTLVDTPALAALPEIAAYLAQNAHDIEVIGWNSNCAGLTMYVPRAVRLTCPQIHWDDDGHLLAADLQARLGSGQPLWVVNEDLPYLPDSQLPTRRTELARFDRPASERSVHPVRLWRIDPSD